LGVPSRVTTTIFFRLAIPFLSRDETAEWMPALQRDTVTSPEPDGRDMFAVVDGVRIFDRLSTRLSDRDTADRLAAGLGARTKWWRPPVPIEDDQSFQLMALMFSSWTVASPARWGPGVSARARRV
jgi:hypothetical protein